MQYRPSYQVVRHSSIVGNSQNLCEEDRIAIPPNPQIDHLLEKETKHVSSIQTCPTTDDNSSESIILFQHP